MALHRKRSVGYVQIRTIPGGHTILVKPEHSASLREYFAAKAITFHFENAIAGTADALEFKGIEIGCIKAILKAWKNSFVGDAERDNGHVD